jgi:hypothetical protein
MKAMSATIRELDCLSPSPDERVALLTSYVERGRESLSPSYDRLLAFYAAAAATMSNVLQRLREADADREIDGLGLFQSIDPLLASEPQAARALLTSASSWHTDEYQRAFLQYVIGTSASALMSEGPDESIIAVFPFLADDSAWTLGEGAFASPSTDREVFLPGLLWEAVQSPTLKFDRRLLQDTGLSADELMRHLRPPLRSAGNP